MASQHVAPTPGRIKLPVKDQRVEDLLLWRDLTKSGIAFGGATLAFTFFQFAKINFLSVTLYLLSTLVFGMLLWSVLGGILKKPPPSLPKALSEGVSEGQVRAYAERVTPLLNRALAFAYRALNGREPLTSVLVAAALYVAAKLSARCSLLALAYAPLFAAFTLPKVYELRKDEIDAAVDSARANATAFYDRYLANVVNRIPRATAASPASSSTTRKLD